MAMVKLEPPEQLGMSLGEAMFTQRAIRRLKPEPVSDEDLKTLMDAASKAPNVRAIPSSADGFWRCGTGTDSAGSGSCMREAWWAKRPVGWSSRECVPEGDLHLSAHAPGGRDEGRCRWWCWRFPRRRDRPVRSFPRCRT